MTRLGGASNKYNNHKTVANGILFDSKREANRYQELLLEERAGLISDLKRQVKYELVPKTIGHGRTIHAVNYIADFVYTRDGDTVVEDAKGVPTDVYKIKKKLMYWRYGIWISEV